MHIGEFKSIVSKTKVIPAVESIFSEIFNDKKYREYCIMFFGFPFLVTSVFLLGSAYFHSFHYIKTSVVVMVFSAVSTYIIYKAGEALTKNIYSVNNAGTDKTYLILGISTIIIALTIIFWLITYVRLKEKEV